MKIHQQVAHWAAPGVLRCEYYQEEDKKYIPNVENKIPGKIIALAIHKGNNMPVFFIELDEKHADQEIGFSYDHGEKPLFSKLQDVHTDVILNQKYPNGKPKKYVYLSPEQGGYDVINDNGIQGKFPLDSQAKINNEFYRVVGYNTQTGEYLVESPDGSKLSNDHFRRMEVVWSPIYKTDIRVKIVREEQFEKKAAAEPIPDRAMADERRMYEEHPEMIREKMHRQGHMGNEAPAPAEPTFVEKTKDEGKEATKRVAVKKVFDGATAAISAFASKHGVKKKKSLNALDAVVKSDIGKAGIKEGLGLLMTFAPVVKDHKYAPALAKELRIGAMTDAGNLVADHITPMVNTVLGALKSAPVAIEQAGNALDSSMKSLDLGALAEKSEEKVEEEEKEVVVLDAGSSKKKSR